MIWARTGIEVECITDTWTSVNNMPIGTRMNLGDRFVIEQVDHTTEWGCMLWLVGKSGMWHVTGFRPLLKGSSETDASMFQKIADHAMTDKITGSINEVRKTFQGDGVTGTVEFGHQHTCRGAKTQPVRVDLSNGRQAFGKYTNPREVRLTIKAALGKYGRRL